mmetsp:Transcript_2084/g.1904  ORF Transcript_2084/g.1904 Transcript_2084/m.1904 type:complete len:106 (+) Transcript_2084:94-411(+)
MIKITMQILISREKEEEDEEEEAEVDEDMDYKKMIHGLQNDQHKSPFADKDTFNPQDYKDTNFDDDDDEDDDLDDYENLAWKSENPEYDSPLDNHCEILYFQDCL